MNTIIPRMAIVLLVASASAAYAATGTAQLPATTVSVSPDAIAAAQVVLASSDEDAAYALSDHRELVVDQFGPAMHIRYGRRHMTVRYDGQGSFVSTDGLLRMQFRLSADGYPDKVSLSIPASWQ